MSRRVSYPVFLVSSPAYSFHRVQVARPVSPRVWSRAYRRLRREQRQWPWAQYPSDRWSSRY